MNQSKLVAILYNLLLVGFAFPCPSHWLINWREIFKPITKRSNCNRVITFDSHLKTALMVMMMTMITTIFYSNFQLFVKVGNNY